MQLVDGWWTDENNNRWNAEKWSKEAAEVASRTLVDCSDCSDCSYCSNCRGCSYCRGCSDCSNCSYCSDCSDCRGCSDCSNCRGCSYCSDCSYCSNCRGCSYCSDFRNNPQIYRTAQIGSRKDITIFYWNSEKCMVKCGCFWDTLDKFEERVKEVHAGTKYEVEYIKEIARVRKLLEDD